MTIWYAIPGWEDFYEASNDGMKQLTKVLVGSRLHGLDTPTSDYDYRGIHIQNLQDVLSPFKTLKNTTWIEGFIYNAYTNND